jgi:hypothetical protein
MTKTTSKTARQDVAIETLRAWGAELLKAEDRHGETKTGWWLDGVWLGPKNDPAAALRILNGAG